MSVIKRIGPSFGVILYFLYRPRQPVLRPAIDCRLRSVLVVRRRAVYASNTCRPYRQLAAATSRLDSPSRDWTTVTPCWLVFQLPRGHRFSESCTLRGTYCSGSHAARPCDFGSPRVALVTTYQSQRGSSTSLLVHKSLLGHTPKYISDLLTPVRSALRASYTVATSSDRGHVDESATELSLLPHHVHRTRCRQTSS